MRSTYLRFLDAVSPACIVAAIGVVYLLALGMGMSKNSALDSSAVLPGAVGMAIVLIALFRELEEEYLLVMATAAWASLSCSGYALYLSNTSLFSRVVFFICLADAALITIYVVLCLSERARVLPKLLIIPILVGGFYTFSVPFAALAVVGFTLALQFMWTTNDWPFWKRLEAWGEK